MIFYFLFIVLFFLSFRYSMLYGRYDQKLEYNTLLIAILFIVIGGLRFDVGSDWGEYEESFLEIEKETELSFPLFFKEPGFYLLNFFFSRFSSEFALFSCFIFVIALFLKIKYIVSNEDLNIYFAFLIYFSGLFLIFDLNALRQGIAIGISLFSTKYIFERRKLFFICIFVALFIHKSAIVFIPAYFLFNNKIRLSTFQYAVITVILCVVGMMISVYASDILALVFGGDSVKHLEYYSEGTLYMTKVSFWGISSIRRYIIWGFILWALRNNNTDVMRFYKNCMLVSFFIFFLLASSMEVSYRLSYYYFAFEMVLIPYAISSIDNIRMRVYSMCFWGIYYFYMIFKLVDNPSGGLNDYNNYLFTLFQT